MDLYEMKLSSDYTVRTAKLARDKKLPNQIKLAEQWDNFTAASKIDKMRRFNKGGNFKKSFGKGDRQGHSANRGGRNGEFKKRSNFKNSNRNFSTSNKSRRDESGGHSKPQFSDSRKGDRSKSFVRKNQKKGGFGNPNGFGGGKQQNSRETAENTSEPSISK